MNRLPRTQITQRDADIACQVLNGATLAETGALYGIQRERIRQIVTRCVFRACPEFRKKYLPLPIIGANKLNVYRQHKRYLIRRIRAAVGPLAAPPRAK